MNARDEGFTLVELLVSMTVLALLLVLLFGGLRFGTRAWERSDTTANAVEDVRSVQGLLRTALERACPRRIAVAAPAVPVVDFTGTPNAMSFLAPQPRAFGEASCARSNLSAKPGPGGVRLAFSFVGADGHPHTRTLFDHLQDVAFAYRGAGGWQDAWSGRAGLPTLVRIRLRFPDGDAHVWPELYVTPRISAENDCAYSPALKTCQGS
ncbi:MAG TPA: prepilin-type N-terminal cleavage/methylation domain-containing protein [Rhizomicrobium sp.]|nr:prepilin-type N-terminal cleavage/methylation domain-containing protein [Rhizomicrobium sp.]